MATASARSSSELAITTTCAAPVSKRGHELTSVMSTLPTGHASTSASRVAVTTEMPSCVRHDASAVRRASIRSTRTTETSGLTNSVSHRRHCHSMANASSRTRVNCNDAHFGQRCSIRITRSLLRPQVRPFTHSLCVGSIAVNQIWCRSRSRRSGMERGQNAAGLSPRDVNKIRLLTASSTRSNLWRCPIGSCR